MTVVQARALMNIAVTVFNKPQKNVKIQIHKMMMDAQVPVKLSFVEMELLKQLKSAMMGIPMALMGAQPCV